MPRPMLTACAALALLLPSPAIASGHGGGEGAPHFIAMAEMRVPIVQGDQAGGRLRITIVLRVDDPDRAGAVEAALPALREAALAAASEFARLHASPFLPVDAARLARSLGAALHAQSAAPDAVLLTQVSAVAA